MYRATRLRLLRVHLLLPIMAGLAWSAAAQSPPVPKFTVGLEPGLVVNVWPADFNRDGRTDLVSATGPFQSPATRLTVALGRGDGTFLPATVLNIAAVPLNVGDMNEDGFVDVIIRRGNSLEVLPGRGNGTFGAPRAVAATAGFTDEVRIWGHVADLDGDGHRDIVVPEPTDMVRWHRGNGDLTFKPAVDLATRGGGYQPAEATSGDFNGDGRRDLAVVSQLEVDVFLNQGGTTFSRSVIEGVLMNDVTTRDLNNDGRLDLIVASGRWDQFASFKEPGMVYILIGNGNGTFQNAVAYDPEIDGTMSVVVGDFNGDGRLDVATGNRSIVLSDSELGLMLWDSITVLPGDGTGRLLTPTTFVLGSVGDEFGGGDLGGPYKGQHHQLNTSDLNQDGRTDLIGSAGAILVNRPAAPNRPPVAFAGADRTDFYHDLAVVLRGQGPDPDNHWVTYTWRDAAGNVISTLPGALSDQPPGTSRTYHLTVDDGHGGVSTDSITVYVPQEGDPFISVDGLVYGDAIVRGVPTPITWSIEQRTVALSNLTLWYSTDDGRTFQVVPGCSGMPAQTGQCTWQNPGPVGNVVRLRLTATGGGREWISVSNRLSITEMPSGWSSADVGAVGAAGTTRFATGAWTVEGSGRDIWDTADEFRFVSRTVQGNFMVMARVASVENLNRWVKAGLMIREDLTAGARHASIFATPSTERGIAFQRRRQANGQSVHTAGPAVAPPGWLALGRIGDTISAYYRPSPTASWVLVGRENLAGLPARVLVGLAVSSHVDGQLATAVFDNVAVDQALMTESQDVGSVGRAGTTTFDGVVYQVQGSGADIWGTADAFRLVSGSSVPARELTARVRSVQNTHAWAKAGVMFRQSPPVAGSPHVMVVVTPGKGVAMQYRADYNAASVQVAVRPGVAPEWVRLVQIDGSFFRGYTSNDGITWQLLGSLRVDRLFGVPALAVTSHNNSALTTAVFENVTLRPFVSQ